MAVKDTVITHASGNDITTEDGRVVRIRVLPPLALRDSFPVVVEHVLVGPDLHFQRLVTRIKGTIKPQTRLDVKSNYTIRNNRP